MTAGTRTSYADGKAMIALTGELDMYSVKNLKEELLDFLGGHRGALSEVHVDISTLEGMDSSGIALLAHLQKKTNEMDAKLYLHRPSRKLRKLFELGYLDAMFEIID